MLYYEFNTNVNHVYIGLAFLVWLFHQMVHTPEDIDVTTAEEIRKGTMNDFEKKQVWLDFALTLMQRFLAFTFVLVFIRYMYFV
jgi:hypothetical protein